MPSVCRCVSDYRVSPRVELAGWESGVPRCLEEDTGASRTYLFNSLDGVSVSLRGSPGRSLLELALPGSLRNADSRGSRHSSGSF